MALMHTAWSWRTCLLGHGPARAGARQAAARQAAARQAAQKAGAGAPRGSRRSRIPLKTCLTLKLTRLQRGTAGAAQQTLPAAAGAAGLLAARQAAAGQQRRGGRHAAPTYPSLHLRLARAQQQQGVTHLHQHPRQAAGLQQEGPQPAQVVQQPAGGARGGGRVLLTGPMPGPPATRPRAAGTMATSTTLRWGNSWRGGAACLPACLPTYQPQASEPANAAQGTQCLPPSPTPHLTFQPNTTQHNTTQHNTTHHNTTHLQEEPDSPWRVMAGKGNSANRVRPGGLPTKRNSAGGMQQLLDDWLD
jgi:hypothetical protein